MRIYQNIYYSLFIALLFSGCSVTPKNLDNNDQDKQGFSRIVKDGLSDQQFDIIEDYSSNNLSTFSSEQIFSRGDTINIRIAGLEEFDGLYQITKQGSIELPFAKPIKAQGLTRSALIRKLESELVKLNWFYQDQVNLDLSVVRLAPVNVSVSGAVFNPGRVSVNNQAANKQEDPIQQSAGAFDADRDLIAALQAAGGVRPDADLNRVFLKRGTQLTHVPLTKIVVAGGFIETPALVNGDEIIVASTNREDSRLIKPSQITPPGMRVLLSNLTAPALNNAQSAVGADTTRLPYGTSLLDSAVSANCIGGTQSANASRSVVLITRNYGSKQQLVIKRSINQLLANSSNDRVNPFLMPNDGIACYDSRFTNFRDVARGIGELVGPFILGGLL